MNDFRTIRVRHDWYIRKVYDAEGHKLTFFGRSLDDVMKKSKRHLSNKKIVDIKYLREQAG